MLIAVVVGAAVAVALGAYGQVHVLSASRRSSSSSATLNLKAWFTTIALALALFQIASAMRIYGRVKWPARMPSWLGDVHRLSGTLAFLFVLPVVYHCLWALGFEFVAGNISAASCTPSPEPSSSAPSPPRCSSSAQGTPRLVAPVGRRHHVRNTRRESWATSSLWFFRNVGFPAFDRMQKRIVTAVEIIALAVSVAFVVNVVRQ